MANLILDVQNVSKRFGDRILFSDISFSVAEGQRVGLIAQNGTGKTTLLSMLTGDEGIDSGNIIYRNGVNADDGYWIIPLCKKCNHPTNMEQMTCKYDVTVCEELAATEE